MKALNKNEMRNINGGDKWYCRNCHYTCWSSVAMGWHILCTRHFRTAMKDGVIVQNGSHAELIKEDGLYQKMWNSQN